MNNSARIKQYSKVSTILACFSNAQLKQILADAKPMHEGIAPIALAMDEFFF